jgi:two-component system, OmpR family, flagellar system response regulator FtcR
MIIVLDSRLEIETLLCQGLRSEGLMTTSFNHQEFSEWFSSLEANEKSTIETVVIGDFADRYKTMKLIKLKSSIPMVAINISTDIESTLNSFLAGADDVVGQHVHFREIAARIGAIKRRKSSNIGHVAVGPLRIYFDSRDPEIDGVAFVLPRRERHILEYLASNRTRRVNRRMIFNAVYGLFEEDVEESVVESHISKLRKKLRAVLGFDPIDNQRYLGYQLQHEQGAVPSGQASQINHMFDGSLNLPSQKCLAA